MSNGVKMVLCIGQHLPLGCGWEPWLSLTLSRAWDTPKGWPKDGQRMAKGRLKDGQRMAEGWLNPQKEARSWCCSSLASCTWIWDPCLGRAVPRSLRKENFFSFENKGAQSRAQNDSVSRSGALR